MKMIVDEDLDDLDPMSPCRVVTVERACHCCGRTFTRTTTAAAASRVRLCGSCRKGSDASAVEHGYRA